MNLSSQKWLKNWLFVQFIIFCKESVCFDIKLVKPKLNLVIILRTSKYIYS